MHVKVHSTKIQESAVFTTTLSYLVTTQPTAAVVPTWLPFSAVLHSARFGPNETNRLSLNCRTFFAPPTLPLAPCPLPCSSTAVNHDYGRADGRCLLDQRDFLAGEPPDQRVLEEIVSAEGVPCWQLKTWWKGPVYIDLHNLYILLLLAIAFGVCGAQRGAHRVSGWGAVILIKRG